MPETYTHPTVARMIDIVAEEMVGEMHAVRRAQDGELTRLGGIGPTLDQQREMADATAQFRELYADLELSVPKPGASDRPGDFRVKILQPLARFSPDFRHVDLRRLGHLSLDGGVARTIVGDALRTARDRTIGSFERPGQLREIRRVDQTGNETVSFHGQPLSWMAAFMSPVRLQVEAFN